MWPNPQENPDLVTFNEEKLNGKLPFLCIVQKMLLVVAEKMFQKLMF